MMINSRVNRLEMNRRQRLPLPSGVSVALIAAILFGAGTPLSKVLLGQVDPILLAGLLYLVLRDWPGPVVVVACLFYAERLPRGESQNE